MQKWIRLIRLLKIPNANMQEIAAQREAIWQAHHERMQAIEWIITLTHRPYRLPVWADRKWTDLCVGDMASDH